MAMQKGRQSWAARLGSWLAARACAASAGGHQAEPWRAACVGASRADRQGTQVVERLEQVGLSNAVIDAQPLLAGADEVGSAQGHEVLGDGGLTFTKHGLDVADANLA